MTSGSIEAVMRRVEVGRHDENVPSTSLSLVVAVFPVMVVLSIVAVPTLTIPPPMPTPAEEAVPAVPLVAVAPDATWASPRRRGSRPRRRWPCCR